MSARQPLSPLALAVADLCANKATVAQTIRRIDSRPIALATLPDGAALAFSREAGRCGWCRRLAHTFVLRAGHSRCVVCDAELPEVEHDADFVRKAKELRGCRLTELECERLSGLHQFACDCEACCEEWDRREARARNQPEAS